MAAIIRSSGKEPDMQKPPPQTQAPPSGQTPSQSFAPKKGGLFDDEDDQDPDESLMFDSKP